MQLSFSGLDNTYAQPQLTASDRMIWHTQHNPRHLEDAQQIARYFSTLYPFYIRSQNSTAWKIHSPGIDFKIRALRQEWEPKPSVGTALEQGIPSPFRKSYFQKALELTLRDIWGRDSFSGFTWRHDTRSILCDASSYYWTVKSADTPAQAPKSVWPDWFSPHSCLFCVIWDSVCHRDCSFCLETIGGCFYGGFLRTQPAATALTILSQAPQIPAPGTPYSHTALLGCLSCLSTSEIRPFSNWSKHFISVPVPILLAHAFSCSQSWTWKLFLAKDWGTVCRLRGTNSPLTWMMLTLTVHRNHQSSLVWQTPKQI